MSENEDILSPPPARRSRSRSPDVEMRRSPRYRSRSPRRFSRSPRRRSPPRGRGRQDPNPEPSNVLGVFGLSLRTTEDDLRHVYEKYGELEKVIIVFDRRMNQSRGFGFVTFVRQEDAATARDATADMEIDGRNIRVDYSVTKKPHSPTPGYYAGKVRRSGYRSRRSRSPYGRRPHYGRRRYSRSRSPPRRRYRSRSRSPYRGRPSRSPYRRRMSPPPYYRRGDSRSRSR